MNPPLERQDIITGSPAGSNRAWSILNSRSESRSDITIAFTSELVIRSRENTISLVADVPFIPAIYHIFALRRARTI